MNRKFLRLVCLMALCLGGAPSAVAQDAAVIDDVVVTARRAGAPMWTVERGDSNVILVGAISGVPRGYDWRADALEAAAARSQRILYPLEGQASLSDIMRLLWRIRTITFLPEGATTGDYLPPATQARVERLMAEERSEAWRRQGLVGLGFDLFRRTGYERRGRDVPDTVRRAARGVPGQPVGVVRGDDLIENLISGPPRAYADCIDAASRAAEVGPEGAARRLDDWRSLRVREVLANPLDQAAALCWPAGDPTVAPVERRLWAEAATSALTEPGITLGVAPLRVLAEPGGVLDQLEAQGLEVIGPDWKAAPPEA